MIFKPACEVAPEVEAQKQDDVAPLIAILGRRLEVLKHLVDGARVLADAQTSLELEAIGVAAATLDRELREAREELKLWPTMIPGMSLRELERYAILRTLEHVGGSTSKAAAILKISARKIQYRLNEYRAMPAGEALIYCVEQESLANSSEKER